MKTEKSSTRVFFIVGMLLASVAVVLCARFAIAQDTVVAPGAVVTQGGAATQPADSAADVGWPRVYTAQGYEVILHQPQVDKWEKYERVHLRAAVVIRKQGEVESVFGSVQASAPTSVDMESRTVFIGPRKVDSLKFGDASAAEVARLKEIMLAALPDEQPLTMSLDRMFAAVLAGEKEPVKSVGINLDPPPIYASETPAILVIVAGKPRFEKVAGTGLMFVANTNWDVFQDTASGLFYLLNGDAWLTTGDLVKGKWSAVKALPHDFAKIPDDENWADVRKNYPGRLPKDVPTVIVTTGPAELIVTEGKPQLEPIADTKLLQVTNTDNDLFLHTSEKQFYLLSAGRWFRAKELTGPWSAATKDLPADFAAIPEDSDAADVLVSVPGTPQADEAVLQASTPQKATINRSEVKVTVVYQGEPKCQPIEGTTVKYAINSPNKVFWADNKYYCCEAGVWFVSGVSTGPWAVATVVPPAIYTIPPTHPSYNVTYVHVYESTPTTVVVGSTSGYSGQYVANGVVLFGAGMLVGALLADDDDNHWHYHYPPSYFSYGCGAHYSHYHGGYYSRSVSHYGPYGGAGAWSGYNPSTGVISRGAYRYGPNGSASARTAYNPWTGNSAGRATASTPYGSWGRSAVTNGEDWARGGYKSNARGTVGGIQTSEGSGIVAGKRRYGSGAAVAKDKDGDMYVGKNGNAYKRDDDGDWYKREDGKWKKPEGNPSTPRPTPQTSLRSSREATPTATATPTAQRRDTASTSDATYRDLDRQAKSRDRGATSTQRASTERQREPSSTRTRSSSSSGTSRGGGSRGGGGRGR